MSLIFFLKLIFSSLYTNTIIFNLLFRLYFLAQMSSLVDMLVDDDMDMHLCHLVAHTAKGPMTDAMVRALVVLFESRGKAMELIQFAINEEMVHQTST